MTYLDKDNTDPLLIYKLGVEQLEIDPKKAYFWVCRSLELILISICNDFSIHFKDEDVYLSRLLYAVHELHLLPKNIVKDLNIVIMFRNNLVHYKVFVDERNPEPIMVHVEYVRNFLQWYLTSYQNGPKMTKQEADSLLPSISPRSSGVKNEER